MSAKGLPQVSLPPRVLKNNLKLDSANPVGGWEEQVTCSSPPDILSVWLLHSWSGLLRSDALPLCHHEGYRQFVPGWSSSC